MKSGGGATGPQQQSKQEGFQLISTTLHRSCTARLADHSFHPFHSPTGKWQKLVATCQLYVPIYGWFVEGKIKN